GASNSPAGNYWANWIGSQYSDQGAGAAMNAGATAPVGGNQAHDNMPPYLTVNFIIALSGIFPTH
ncbi:MAG TPA: phage tail protein, partial [Verrucomicrobiae bacterium]